MALTIPTPVLGTSLADSTLIDGNFTAVVSKFGNIDNSDIKAGAGIDTAKLAAKHYEMVFSLDFVGTPAASAVVPVALIAVPQDDTTSSYTCVAWANYNTVGQGAATCTWRVDYGTVVAAAWSTVANVVALQTIPVGATSSMTGSTAFATAVLSNSGAVATPRFLGLFFTAAGGTPAATVFNVTIKCKRTLGLRT